MYSIEKNSDRLYVTFEGDLDYSTIKQIIYGELAMPEFCELNDIWILGENRAHIRLGEIQTVIDDFSNFCPPEACDKKMAIVAQAGLTAAILELLADGLNKKLPFSCRMFRTLEAAEEWIGFATSQVA